jgi:mono/diheme cytochrome c family protein
LALANGARSTKDGVFTADQVDRGKSVYEQSCKNCHQADFYSERLQRWNNKSVSDLFEAVSTSMPADNVGSLATSQYVDVLAYVFSITGSPVGKSELTADNMEAVKIAAP